MSLVPVDVELGVYLSEQELETYARALRDLPCRLATLGVEAYRLGYLDAIRAREPDGAGCGYAVESVSARMLHTATAGWTVDERAEPWRLR